jgi:hypothetical protein
MAKTKISDFNSNPALNTDIDSINIAEGCSPSGINDAIRELMSQLKDFQTGAQGDSFNGPVGTTTAAAGAFTTLSATGNVTLGDASTDTLNVGNGGLIKDSSGNLGLGVTPSAWVSVFKALQVGAQASLSYYNGSTYLSANFYDNGAGSKYLTSDYATQYKQTGGQHQWFNAPSGTAGNAITFTQAMTLDASGNLCIGTTSTSTGFRIDAQYAGSVNIQAKNTSGSGYAQFKAVGSTTTVNFGSDANGGYVETTGAYSTTFYTNGSERARIDSSGNLLVGTSSQINSGKACISFGGTFFNGLVLSESANISSSTYLVFSNGSTVIGSVSRVGATSAVVYNTTSDYRLKTVTGAVTGQGARIDALKPIDYLWKEGGQQARGFLAHEFQTVYPNSVSGDKDAVDAEGNPKYQAMQASTAEVIADLVAEIQSLRKRLADAGI